MDRTFLRSRVARRIFGLFLVSAFVPVLVLAALAWHQLRQTNEAHARDRLQARSSAYARALHERLLNASLALQTLAARPNHGPQLTSPVEQREEVFFRRVLRVEPPRGGDVALAAMHDWAPAAPSPDELSHLAGGRARRRAPTTRNGGPWMAVALDPRDPGNGLLWAELGLRYLWESDEVVGSDVALCVVQQEQTLHCTDPARAPGGHPGRRDRRRARGARGLAGRRPCRAADGRVRDAAVARRVHAPGRRRRRGHA
jgi:hypothetical protein